jgi:hypothetical protein
MHWLLLQVVLLGTDPVHGTEFTQIALKNSAVIEQRQKTELTRQEAEFRKRFNQMLDALAAFSEKYNNGGGNVWPSKQAEDLHKAMKALEKVDSLKGAR